MDIYLAELGVLLHVFSLYERMISVLLRSVRLQYGHEGTSSSLRRISLAVFEGGADNGVFHSLLSPIGLLLSIRFGGRG